MRLVTWNVNSIRSRADRVAAWLERSDADVRDLVAQGVEHHLRELVVPALGLLQRDDVDVTALEPGRHAVGAAADGVDVPGG